MPAHEQAGNPCSRRFCQAYGKDRCCFCNQRSGCHESGYRHCYSLYGQHTAGGDYGKCSGQSYRQRCFPGSQHHEYRYPCYKEHLSGKKIEDLEDVLYNAFRVANSGRKGPVLVDITKDVTAASTNFKPRKPLPTNPKPAYTKEDLSKVASIINTSEKPVIYCGGGVPAAGAEKELHKLMELADIPAVHTLMSAGTVRYDDPRSLGLVGMHGTIAANKAIDRADLVLALGTRFSDRVALNPDKFGKRAIKVQVDIDSSEINKNVVVDYGITADVKDFLADLLPLIKKKDRSEWVSLAMGWKSTTGDVKCGDADLHPSEIIGTVCDLTDDDTIYVTDVGQHQIWAAQFLKHKNSHKFITSGGLGTMGFGYGASIGAQVGCPDSRVIHFTSDGSLHMNLNECCTAVSQNLPIITIIMNNRVLGMVYQWQAAFYNKRYSSTTPERKTDFVRVAEGFGAKGFRASTPEEFEEVFRKALKENGPVWIECAISCEERVLPMIPSGGTIEDMIIG